jgi:hypothetical protein
VTVNDRNTLDYVAQSDDGSRVTLIMVEDRPLDTPGVRQETLAKVNEYMALIASEDFFELVPEAKSASIVRVQYNVLDDPEQEPDLVRVLVAANNMFRKNGIDFQINHLNL